MDEARIANLLGVVALAATDEMGRSAARSPSAAAALVHLSAHPGSSVGRLCGALGLSQPATVRAVDRLQHEGLLDRGPGADGRTLALRLTPAGEAAARGVLEHRARALCPLLSQLGASEREHLGALLASLAAGLADDQAQAEHACRLCDRGACASGDASCPLQRTAA